MKILHRVQSYFVARFMQNSTVCAASAYAFRCWGNRIWRLPNFCQKKSEKVGIFFMDCRVTAIRSGMPQFSIFISTAGAVPDVLNQKLREVYSYFSQLMTLHSFTLYGQRTASFSGFRTFSDRQ